MNIYSARPHLWDMGADLTFPEKIAGSEMNWGGVTSFVINGDEVVEVNAVKTSGSYYRTVKFTEDNKVDKSNIGDNPEEFHTVGVAAICTDPTEGNPRELFEIYANEDKEWTYHEVKAEVEQ